MGVNKVEYGSSTLVDLTGDTVTPETLLQGETAHNAAGNRITGTARPGVQTFNGRSGSVLPIAGDYSAEQVDYDSNKTVKQVIDALATKEASDIAGQQSLLKDTVGWTGKNLLKRTSNPNLTVENVTFTVNADNSITCNGTASGGLVWIIESVLCKANKEYILTGCPSGGGSESTNYWLGAYINGTIDKRDTGNGVLLKYATDTTVEVRLRIPNGYTANNFTFYPMIRKADITDPTYEPYHESVETMYEEEIHGVNLLKPYWHVQAGTKNGVTTIINSDGSFTLNGVAEKSISLDIKRRVPNYNETDLYLPKGRYIISGNITGSDVVGINAATTYNDKYKRISQNICGSEEAEFEISESTQSDYKNSDGTTLVAVYIEIPNGTTLNSVRVYPMLRKADIEDSTYRPYNHQAIQNQLNAQGVLGAKNLLPYPYSTSAGTYNGLTYTVNSDGTLTLNGTSTKITNFNFAVGFSNNNRLIYSLGKAQGVRFKGFITQDSTDLAWTGADGSCEFQANGSYTVHLIIYANQTFNNETLYPMLRLASDPDDTYQPYAMTNRELTEKVFEKRTLTSADNLNDIRETGIYGIRTKPTNAPEDTTIYCTLIVQKTSIGDIRQIIIRSTNAAAYIYTRSYGGSPLAWTPWCKFTGTVVS